MTTIHKFGQRMRGVIKNQFKPTGHFKLEAIRFLLVGGANFVLTFVLFFSLYKILHINYLIALSGSWCFGMLFSYVLNFTWVFTPEEKLDFSARFLKYFLASLASIVMNLLALHALVKNLSVDAFYAQCALMPLVVGFNFITAKFWSLRPNS